MWLFWWKLLKLWIRKSIYKILLNVLNYKEREIIIVIDEIKLNKWR